MRGDRRFVDWNKCFDHDVSSWREDLMTASETANECIETVDIQQCVESAEDEREMLITLRVSQ